MSVTKPLTTLTFRMEGAEEGRLEVDLLQEITAYKRIVIETAKDIWRAAHPESGRLPNGFEDSIRLKIEGPFKTRSTAVPIVREYPDADGQAVFQIDDEVDVAAGLIEDAIDSAAEGRPMPRRVPRHVIPMIGRFGREMRDGDSITFQSVRRNAPVVFNVGVRERLARWTVPTYEDTLSIVGEVTEADVISRKYKLRAPAGPVIEGAFAPEQEKRLTEALHKHATLRVAVVGVGEYSSHDASLVRILRTDALTPFNETESYDSTAPPLWQTLAALGATVPDSEWAKVPTDLASNFHKYAHDTDEDEDSDK